MKRKALLSHASDEWATPKDIYMQAMAKGMYDPCPLGGLIDNLKSDWGASNFVNPPYSQLLRWVEKSIEQHRKGKSVLLMIPAIPIHAREAVRRGKSQNEMLAGRQGRGRIAIKPKAIAKANASSAP